MRVSIAHCTNSSPALTRIIETIQLAEGRIEASRQPRLLLRGAQGAPNLRVVRPSPSSDVSPRGGADLQRGTVRQGAEACEPVRDLARERHRWHAEPGYGGGRLQRGGLLGPRVRTSRRQLHAALHCISLSPLASRCSLLFRYHEIVSVASFRTCKLGSRPALGGCSEDSSDFLTTMRAKPTSDPRWMRFCHLVGNDNVREYLRKSLLPLIGPRPSRN